MKPWIIILTHGRAGEELVKSTEMIVGTLENVYALSLLPGMSPEDYLGVVQKVLNNAPSESLILTDLFGGTPSNVAIMLSKDYNISAVSGVNTAMLIEADTLRETLYGVELAQALVDIGREACREITTLLKSMI